MIRKKKKSNRKINYYHFDTIFSQIPLNENPKACKLTNRLTNQKLEINSNIKKKPNNNIKITCSILTWYMNLLLVNN